MLDVEMVDMGALVVALGVGVALGTLYFGMLWLTLRRLAQTHRPAMALTASVMVRLAVLLTGFYLVLDGGHWDRLLASLIGFITVRSVLVRILRPGAHASVARSEGEASS